jgi:hypothetical protein
MRNTIFAGLALTALAATPAMAAPAPVIPAEAPAPPPSLLASSAPGLAALAYAPQSRVQVWMDGARDVYRPGERIHVRVRSQQDGYLAVFHIDTNGDVDIIYPRSEAEDGWVDGGRTVNLGSRSYDYVRSRGGYGMGYVMAVTLDEPLELWRVREMYGIRTAGWDGNRGVFGDPFYAMDELVRAIVPEGAYGYEAVDYATYHVGRRYRYPRYACYDGYGDWYSYRGAYWDDCDRVRILLVSYPWYYDTHRWRGSRRVYYERYYYRTARTRPLHGYKERTDGVAPPARAQTARRPEPQRRPSPGGSGGYDRPGGGTSADGGNTSRRPQPSGRVDGGARRPDGGTAADRPAGSRRPDRGSVAGDSRGGDARSGPSQRPTRGATRPQQQDDGAAEPRQDRPVQPSRERPTFQRRPQNEGGSTRSAEPRREPPPQRSAEPRRESPPARSAEPRRESPPQRSAEPRRESRPPSSSSGGSRSSGSSGGSRSSGSSGGSRSSSPPPPRSPNQ